MSPSSSDKTAPPIQGDYLEGKMLIAMPSMSDPRFERSLVYLCVHNADGAMGIIINKKAPHVTFSELLEQMGIPFTSREAGARSNTAHMAVYFGGPVEVGRGFILHSDDYFVQEATQPISGHISLTATSDILKEIAAGHGPRQALFALGYAGWAPGQLEAEIQDNGWLYCEADRDLIFSPESDTKYETALARLGVNLTTLSGDMGHA